MPKFSCLGTFKHSPVNNGLLEGGNPLAKLCLKRVPMVLILPLPEGSEIHAAHLSNSETTF